MTYKTPMRINFNRLNQLTTEVPNGLDIWKKKTTVSKPDRAKFCAEDDGVCHICGIKGEYGTASPYVQMSGRHNLHHIIPNGNGTRDNIVTLCINCHRVVHNMLYIEGKWRYQNL
jgi:5-methylcytosine-specific restriction endonuclease McrA